MEAKRARQIRDWVLFNQLNVPKRDEANGTGTLDIDSYRKAEQEFGSFVKERVVPPDGNLAFDKTEYLGDTNPFLVGIRDTQRQYLVRHFRKHNKKLFWLSLLSTPLMYAAFLLSSLLGLYLSCGTSLLLVWKIPLILVSYIGLVFFAFRLLSTIEDCIFWSDEKDEENEKYAERFEFAQSALVRQNYAIMWAVSRYARAEVDFTVSFDPYGKTVTSWDRSSRWRWKNVGKDKFIIVDKTTGKEPPLVPGTQPYNL